MRLVHWVLASASPLPIVVVSFAQFVGNNFTSAGAERCYDVEGLWRQREKVKNNSRVILVNNHHNTELRLPLLLRSSSYSIQCSAWLYATVVVWQTSAETRNFIIHFKLSCNFRSHIYSGWVPLHSDNCNNNSCTEIYYLPGDETRPDEKMVEAAKGTRQSSICYHAFRFLVSYLLLHQIQTRVRIDGNEIELDFWSNWEWMAAEDNTPQGFITEGGSAAAEEGEQGYFNNAIRFSLQNESVSVWLLVCSPCLHAVLGLLLAAWIDLAGSMLGRVVVHSYIL